MRRFAIACACLLSLGGRAAGQQGQPTFRSGVTLVSVDVVVLDKHDKPVSGLTASDFDVTLNGKVQPVRALTYVRAAGTAESDVEAMSQPIGRTIATNATPHGERRTFVVLVDDLSISAMDGKSMFESAQRFVDKLPVSDLIGVTTSGGAAGTVNPTQDRAKIHAALKQAAGAYADPRLLDPDGPTVGIAEALDIDLGDNGTFSTVVARECTLTPIQLAMTPDQLTAASVCASGVQRAARRTAALTKVTTARQMQAFETVITAMAKATGIKHLIVLTEGLGVTRDLAALVPVSRAAAAAGVQISILYKDSEMNMSDSATGASVRRVDDRTLGAGMQTVADMSGGNYYHVIGQADQFFDRVASAASALYRLGLDEPAGSMPGKDIAVSARVRRPGLTVRANRTAISSTAAPAVPVAPVEDQLREAIDRGILRDGVPIAVGTALRKGSASAPVDLFVNVMIPASATWPLTTMFALVEERGGMRTGRKIVAAPADGGAYRVSFALPIPAGTSRFRFAAADASGSVGSVETVVVAKMARLGPFGASDLLTSWTDRDGQAQFLGLEDMPATAKAIDATLELYATPGAALPGDVHVRFGLYASDQPRPIVERDVVPVSSGDTLRSEAEFMVDTIEPGKYLLRASILVGDKQVGSTQVSLRKR